MPTNQNRRLPVGAEVLPREGVHFRVWAPHCRKVEVVFEGESGETNSIVPSRVELGAEAHGYFSGHVPPASGGTLYRYCLDGKKELNPDPASRFQPYGPHGPSQIIDPTKFRWTDNEWPGITIEGQVIYEMHIGTFTREGTWNSAIRELEELGAAGITVLELMPLHEFPGRFGWGYDGVDLFAPAHLYGEPDDFRRFVDKAHGLGLGVIVDVVYNHFGPDGNYLKHFSGDYFTGRHVTDWGEAINFDGENSGAVREFFIANAGYWIDEYHLDGLRLDATQNIYDSSTNHMLASITERVRQAGGGRSTIIVAENESQQTKLVRPADQGGYGMDGLWNDDFHHLAMVTLTGHREAYYTDYLGTSQEFISATKWGYLYQGQRYKWQKQRRGSPTFGLKPATFINFIQNHDQIANSGQGLRCHLVTSPGCYRAMTTLLLLGPGTPMLFQGQEFAASSPFLFFADHERELAKLVRKGRLKSFNQFPSLALPETQARFADPSDPTTFKSCKLDFSERENHAEAYALHRDLLKLRREDPVFRTQRSGGVDGAVLSPKGFVLRFFGVASDDRLLLVNFATDIYLDPAPEPLLAPPENMEWAVFWSSEDLRYGGSGTPPLDTAENWLIPGEAAVVLLPKKL